MYSCSNPCYSVLVRLHLQTFTSSFHATRPSVCPDNEQLRYSEAGDLPYISLITSSVGGDAISSYGRHSNLLVPGPMLYSAGLNLCLYISSKDSDHRTAEYINPATSSILIIAIFLYSRQAVSLFLFLSHLGAFSSPDQRSSVASCKEILSNRRACTKRAVMIIELSRSRIGKDRVSCESHVKYVHKGSCPYEVEDTIEVTVA